MQPPAVRRGKAKNPKHGFNVAHAMEYKKQQLALAQHQAAMLAASQPEDVGAGPSSSLQMDVDVPPAEASVDMEL